MTEFKQVTLSEEYLWKYWDGPENWAGRYFMYLQRGFGLFNEIKNYLLIAFTTFWTIKAATFFGIDFGYLWAGVITLIFTGAGLPVLFFLGRWDILKLSKIREFITTMKGTVNGYNGYNIQVKLLEQNDKIIELLEVISENIKG